MNLPSFDIPVPPLGFDIPLLAHPPLVHFAIVLPVIILIIEIINVIVKKRGLTAAVFTFYIFLMLVFVAAYVTGKNDGSEAYDMLTKAGQTDLKAHKLIGTYLMLGTFVLFFLKLFAVALRTWWMKLLYLLALLGFVAAVFYQGKEGGELVYKYGANNDMVMELSNQIDDLKDDMDDLKEECGKSDEATETEEEKAPAATTQEPQPAPETKPAEKPAEKSTEEAPEKEENATEPETKTEEAAPEKEEPAPAAEENKENTEESNATGAEVVKEKVQEAAQSATENVKEVAQKATESAKEAVKSVKDAAGSAIDKAKEMMGGGETEQ